jgi:hypothetical protein
VKHFAERGNHGISRYRLLHTGFGGHCAFPPAASLREPRPGSMLHGPRQVVPLIARPGFAGTSQGSSRRRPEDPVLRTGVRFATFAR